MPTRLGQCVAMAAIVFCGVIQMAAAFPINMSGIKKRFN